MNHPDRRILIVDDENPIRKYLHLALQEKGYQVLEAENAQEGLRILSEQKTDLVILDLGLPDHSGKEVLRKIRSWSKVPVLILTAQSSDDEKVELLDAGADDYLTKPFHLPELLARLRVMERHILHKHETPVFASGPLKIDFEAHSVSVHGKPVKLTGTEYNLLKLLALNAGRLVTQRQILLEVWGPNAVEQSHYLRVYITQIRKKIEADPSNPELIVTEPGVGYRLTQIESQS
ncbi:MAG: response regulator [Bdellovibrionales bacterium]|nr:response regulator [Bdellovibrionales bacterium]